MKKKVLLVLAIHSNYLFVQCFACLFVWDWNLNRRNGLLKEVLLYIKRKIKKIKKKEKLLDISDQLSNITLACFCSPFVIQQTFQALLPGSCCPAKLCKRRRGRRVCHAAQDWQWGTIPWLHKCDIVRCGKRRRKQLSSGVGSSRKQKCLRGIRVSFWFVSKICDIDTNFKAMHETTVAEQLCSSFCTCWPSTFRFEHSLETKFEDGNWLDKS